MCLSEVLSIALRHDAVDLLVMRQAHERLADGIRIVNADLLDDM